MVGGDTGAVSAAGGDTGVRIFHFMRTAVDTHSNLDTHCHSYSYSYSYANTFSNPGAYSDSDPHATDYDCANTFSNPGAHSDSDPNAVGVISPASSKPAPTIG